MRLLLHKYAPPTPPEKSMIKGSGRLKNIFFSIFSGHFNNSAHVMISYMFPYDLYIVKGISFIKKS